MKKLFVQLSITAALAILICSPVPAKAAKDDVAENIMKLEHRWVAAMIKADTAELDKIESDGNVRIVQENRTGLASHGVYESKQGKITLTGGNPKVMQGADTVTGEVITYFIDDERSNVTGGRVEAVIHPKPKNDAPPKKSNADKR